MIHLVAFSGGKDSTALVLWMREQGLPFQAVFCDTGWEHPLTLAYIEEINQTLLGGKLVTLRSERWPGGMVEMVTHKQRIPGAIRRFCTDYLKVKPMIAWIAAQDDEVTVYQGIRAAESPSRAKMDERQWSDDYDAWLVRPLLAWSAEQVFEYLKLHGVEPNPLYRLGASRVGCFPCVLINHGELKRLMRTMPEIWDRIALLENVSGRSFFPPNYIPARFHSGLDPKSGHTFPTAADVKAYIIQRHDIDENEPVAACMSIYNLCE